MALSEAIRNRTYVPMIKPWVVRLARTVFEYPRRARGFDARVCCDWRAEQSGCNKTVDHTFLVTDLVQDHRPAIAGSDRVPIAAGRC